MNQTLPYMIITSKSTSHVMYLSFFIIIDKGKSYFQLDGTIGHKLKEEINHALIEKLWEKTTSIVLGAHFQAYLNLQSCFFKSRIFLKLSLREMFEFGVTV